MTVYIINGPNINLLGVREPGIYGNDSYDDLISLVTDAARRKGLTPVCRQSNHEGDLVDYIHEAYASSAVGIIINPAAYTHTSIALLDAVSAVGIPTVEVHISAPSKREPFRKISYIREACIGVVEGEGISGYVTALDMLTKHLSKKNEDNI